MVDDSKDPTKTAGSAPSERPAAEGDLSAEDLKDIVGGGDVIAGGGGRPILGHFNTPLGHIAIPPGTTLP